MKLKKLIRQANLWKYFAWSFPILYLAGLYLLELFGFDNYISKAIVIGGEIFFVVAVIWWWWAIHNIVAIMKTFQHTDKKLSDLLDDLKQIRKNIK